MGLVLPASHFQYFVDQARVSLQRILRADCPKKKAQVVASDFVLITDPCLKPEQQSTAPVGTTTGRYAPEDDREHRAWSRRLGRDLRTGELSSQNRAFIQFPGINRSRGQPSIVEECYNVFFGIDRVDTSQPDTPFGTVIRPGGEGPAGFTENRFSATRWNFAAMAPAGVLGINTQYVDSFFIKLSYYSYSGSSSANVEPGTDAVAQTFIVANPLSGFTGVLQGATGMNWNAQTEGNIFDLALMAKRITVNMPAPSGGFPVGQGIFAGSNVQQHAGLGVRYRHGEASNTVTAQNLTFLDIRDVITTQVNYDFLGINGYYGVNVAPRGASGFTAGAGASLGLGGTRATGSASEHFQCPGCGATERDVHLHVDFNDTRFTAIAGGHLNVGYRFNRSSAIFATAGVEYVSAVPSVQIRPTPNQQTQLDFDSSTTLNFGLYYQHTFVPPSALPPSDVRLKRDVVGVGRLPGGLALYRYRYLWSEVEYVGVMAQEVERVMPEAVKRGADGFLRVDYGRLGTRLMTWAEWVASREQLAAAAR